MRPSLLRQCRTALTTRGQRTTVGHIGQSPSHVVNEYLMDSMADWEKFMSIVATGKFKGFSEEMAKYIVPGSQHWVVLRIV
jgi:ATP sulfurylase